MKIRLLLASLCVIAFTQASLEAQLIKTHKKEVKKAVKHRTKDYKKQGYTPKGVGTIEMYVTKAANLEFETNKEGQLQNAVVYTSALSPSYEGAVTACRAAARAALAGNIETRVGELVKRSLNSDQVSAESAQGINQVVVAGKQLIAQRISMEDTFVLFREVQDEADGKTLIEVEYASYYSNDMALRLAQKYIREEMKGETEALHKDLDKIFSIN